jgi:aspartyl-tRNA(Asn)/glutamyl-tRNA(Gln) amidotransferase subunit A
VNPFADLRQLRRGLDRKEFSSVELTRLYLQRLKTLGAAHRAVAELTEEHALAQARAADNTPKRSPLHGIPFGAKDLLATKGIPTRWGSPGHADQVFDYDATVIDRLYAAGAVLVAKLEMIELAGGGNYNQPNASRMGACVNAWDAKLWAGGSSSGSGAALGLGCVPFAIGSETSGSITCPCAFNGVSGLRPTYGRVSRYGAMPLCWSLDKIGPMARSIDDAAVVLAAMAGPDANDPSTFTEPLRLNRRGPRPRIGLLPENFTGNQAEACGKAYQDALTTFRRLGYEFVDVAYPDTGVAYNLAVGIIVDAEGASAHENFIRGTRLKELADPHQVAGFAASLETPATDYLWAMRARTKALGANRIWEQCDVIFTPVFYHRAVPLEGLFSQTFQRMGGDGGPANLLGWPSAAFPIGFEDGAPLGGQLIAPAYREDVSVRVARDFQRATDFHRRISPLASV